MKLLKLEKYRCNFCNLLSAYLDGNEIPYDSVNVEDEPMVAAKYGIMAAPVLILLDEEGKEVDRVTGFFPDQVEELLKKMK